MGLVEPINAPLQRPVSRRFVVRALAFGGGAALLAACQQPTAQPTAAPAAKTGGAAAAPTAASQPPVAPPVAATAVPKSAAPAGFTPPADWEQRWSQLIEAAKREGRVVFNGPPTPDLRTELPAAFQKRFGVEMEYLGGRTGDLMTRLESERGAGQYTVDALTSGAQSLYTVAYPNKWLDPIKPALIHPEALNPANWTAGKPWFMEPEEQYILRLASYVTSQISVNSELQDPNELTSWRSLLNPKFRGKISVWDPTVSGTGWNTANYLLSQFGDDFIRQLYVDQQPGVSREDRQLSDWMARGQYPISIGLGSTEIEPLKTEGFKISSNSDLSDAAGIVTAGFGLLGLFNNAPHPNAAKLFVNWMASKEGNETFNKAQVLVSTRTDVNNSWAPDYVIPKPGVSYFDTYDFIFTVNSRSPEEQERMKRLTSKSA